MNISEKLGKLMALAHHITMTTKADVFVNYSGHIDGLDVYYYEKGWGDSEEKKNIVWLEDVTFRNVNKAIRKLKELEKELKNGTN